VRRSTVYCTACFPPATPVHRDRTMMLCTVYFPPATPSISRWCHQPHERCTEAKGGCRRRTDGFQDPGGTRLAGASRSSATPEAA